ncbi:SAM-dependent methyltransferase [Sorangium cellulosum]|uniref:SAM-dependent methyltransferase n=1 Tax=Sorangium cellulosum TaxID=56 RepID=UPI001F172A33|nr:cyclopropane-fatty-acyl-phospholipid synthase family protein [Sorangium cellulosum]
MSLLSRPFKEALARLLERHDGIPFELRLWGGERLRFGAGEPEFAVTFRTRRALCEAALRSTLGLGEAYVRREVVFEGDLEDALTGLFQLARTVADRLPRLVPQFELPFERGAARVLDALNPGLLRGAARREKLAVERYYGLGNDFYPLFLDRRLQTSCGYFTSPGEALDDAQAHKLSLVARKLALRRGQRLLDLGCGWGHFMFHAAETYGVQCLGITLCDNQARYIREQAAARRLPVEVRVMSCAELEDEARWDRIVSFGAMCHAGERRIEVFYDRVRALLARGGLCLLESVTREKESPRTDPFLEKHIFPGYWPPSLDGMAARAAARGLDVLDAENLRRHSALTAQGWRRNLLENRERIARVTGFGEAFMRTWDFYLASAVAAFRTGHLSFVQMVLANGPQREIPLARAALYAAEEPLPRERAPVAPSVQVGSRAAARRPEPRRAVAKSA